MTVTRYCAIYIGCRLSGVLTLNLPCLHLRLVLQLLLLICPIWLSRMLLCAPCDLPLQIYSTYLHTNSLLALAVFISLHLLPGTYSQLTFNPAQQFPPSTP